MLKKLTTDKLTDNGRFKCQPVFSGSNTNKLHKKLQNKTVLTLTL